MAIGNKEIERKFLVDEDMFLNEIGMIKGKLIMQGYLLNLGNHTLRVRTYGEDAFITYKGPTTGITRTEIESRIPNILGRALLRLCKKVIRKKRTLVPLPDGLVVEVDRFYNVPGVNLIAEIELPSEDARFSKPEWLLDDVSDSPYYYNSHLISKVL